MMKVPLRFKEIKYFCKGKVLNLGSTNNENEFNLNTYLRKEHEVYSVDITGECDYYQDLNAEAWKISFGFDTIIAGEILEHISNPILFIKNCRKLLNKNGVLIITTPNATSLIYLLNPSWCVGYRNKLKEDNSHIHSFTSGMLKFLLKENGFKILKLSYLNEFLNNPLGLLLAKLFKRLRGDILIVGEKI